MNSADQITRTEQHVLCEISDAISGEGISLYEDRDEYGEIGFLVCRDTPTAREIVEDTPALYEERGASLIIRVTHPDREA